MATDQSDYQELRLKQAELAVSKQIISELKNTRKQDVYIRDTDRGDRDIDDPSITQEYAVRDVGLQRLVKKGLIQILNEGELIRIGIHIRITDMESFRSFYTDLFESIPSAGNGARIVYSTKTGRGKLNGKPFKLNRKSRNRKVFEYLAKRPNKYISKDKLWVVAGEKGKYSEDSSYSTEVFNTIITTLRESVSNISNKHLRLKGRVILDAEVTLTE